MKSDVSPHEQPSVVATSLPNGQALAALIASGIGSMVLGVATTLAQANASMSKLLNFYNPVGPLMGKTCVAVLAWAVSWIVFCKLWKGKNVNTSLVLGITTLFIFIGLIGTFPPFFELFSPHK